MGFAWIVLLVELLWKDIEARVSCFHSLQKEKFFYLFILFLNWNKSKRCWRDPIFYLQVLFHSLQKENSFEPFSSLSSQKNLYIFLWVQLEVSFYKIKKIIAYIFAIHRWQIWIFLAPSYYLSCQVSCITKEWVKIYA